MKCVYEASDPVNAEIVKDYLASWGMDVFIQGVFGWGGRGDLPANAYPQVCVARDADAGRARDLIRMWERGEDPRPPWTCVDCGERMDGQFSDCWRCGAEKP
ncbi:DUF2007 domain-containing protein [uncultured Abyssibacter sp.]|uniref:putative signal transducing protein n=1 Tax=uncultured Abyssibacter sp. TaxID=2320202 RepID=UPI0032B116E6